MSDDQKPKVGYKNPPVQHQFKSKTSGNPRGRPPKIERSFTERQWYRDVLAVTERPSKNLWLSR